MKLGEAGIGILLTVVGLLFTASIGISWNAFNRADAVTVELSTVREDIAEIKTDVRWLRETISQGRVLGVVTSTIK